VGGNRKLLEPVASRLGAHVTRIHFSLLLLFSGPTDNTSLAVAVVVLLRLLAPVSLLHLLTYLQSTPHRSLAIGIAAV